MMTPRLEYSLNIFHQVAQVGLIPQSVELAPPPSKSFLAFHQSRTLETG